MDLLHAISDLALKSLPEKKLLALRAFYFSTRKKMSPALKLIYGTYTANDLREHLLQKIGTDFEILMVHGSFNHMLPMYTGTALEVVRMLIDFCGKDKTLVMPAFYFGDSKLGSVHEIFEKNPKFNLRATPSQMGIMSELFRRSKGVIQSRHPVYRVSALGPLAVELVAGHENCATPAGPGSPFEYMAQHNAKIIGIGKSFHVMTQVHHVDDIMGKEFPVPRRKVAEDDVTRVTVVDGKEEFPAILRKDAIEWRFNIAKLPKILRNGEMEYWSFHHTPLFSANAKPVTERLIAAAKQGQVLYDPR